MRISWLLGLFCLGPIASLSAGGVTNIKEIVNNTTINLEVGKLDIPVGSGLISETTGTIPPNGGIWRGDMWIPWAENTEEFSKKRLEIRSQERTLFWIWQTGELVRYGRANRFVNNAPQVPGKSESGGERRLFLSMEGSTIAFTFQAFRP